LSKAGNGSREVEIEAPVEGSVVGHVVSTGERVLDNMLTRHRLSLSIVPLSLRISCKASFSDMKKVRFPTQQRREKGALKKPVAVRFFWMKWLIFH
jgi:hypothetical protein